MAIVHAKADAKHAGLIKRHLSEIVIASLDDVDEEMTDSEVADAVRSESAIVPRGEPKSMIPGEELSEMEQLANAKLKPYFDANASQTEKAVSPGDRFDVYMFAEYDKDAALKHKACRVAWKTRRGR